MRKWIISFLMIMLVVSITVSTATYAQDGGETATPSAPSPEGSTTIHVVQRSETLFEIAQQYGTTVDAIATANSITDARFLDVGQRLLIPNAQKDTSGAVSSHTVQPGETLDTLAIRYQTTPTTLARLNNISHSRRLYAGQIIRVNEGEDGRTPLGDLGLYVAQAGDTQLKIAAHFGIPLLALRRANAWTPTTPIWKGQRILLPGRTDLTFVDLPDPLVSFKLSPLPAIQGETMQLIFETSQELDAFTLKFMGRTVAVDEISSGVYGTMLGIHAMAEPDIYTLELDFGGRNGYSVRFEVTEGDYSFEAIVLPASQQALLDTNVVQPELDKISTIMSGFTSPPVFDGLFSLPTSGAMTSNFGTRRTYNSNDTLTFHGGSDFGGITGTPIVAPAAGTVVLVDSLRVRGNTVIIDHGWGVYTGYWHQLETFVYEGQFVIKGETIGSIGSTGLSTGDHLHWEMWVSGVQVNPLRWVQYEFDN